MVAASVKLHETSSWHIKVVFQCLLFQFCFSCFVLAALLLSFTFVSAAAQNAKPVLVIFHDLGETSDDLAEAGNSALQTGLFSEIVLADYGWKTETVPEAAARIFKELSVALTNEQFVLYGFGKGGLIAEWIATRVKQADGRIVRVITVDAPFDGLQRPESEMNWPGLRDIAPNSSTLQELRLAPVNNIGKIEFVRAWERNNSLVVQDSAFRKPSGGEAQTSQLVVRTKPFDPREAFPEILAQAQKDFQEKLYTQVVSGCEYITKVEPKHVQANSLMGLSNFTLAQGESNSAKSAELFALAYRQLATAMEAGDNAYFFTVVHHHAMGDTPGVMMFGGFCYGRLALYRDIIVFQSLAEVPAGSFIVPLSQVYDLRIESEKGRLHMEIGEKLKKYNFFSHTVNNASSTAQLQPNANIGVTRFNCSGACYQEMEAIYRLIEHAKKLPNNSTRNPEKDQDGVSLNLVHWAVRDKNKHAGTLSLSSNGVSWLETGHNADSKHNFRASCAEVKLESFGKNSVVLNVEQNKKSNRFTFHCPSCKEDSDSAIGIVRGINKNCGVSLISR